MKPQSTVRHRLIDAVTMLLVSGLSLILLMYVGFGEAKRTYEQFYLEKLVAQGRVVQTTLETFLGPGLPMKQFVGFATLTEPILASDSAIASMATYDRNGQRVFVSGDDSTDLLPKSKSMDDGVDKAYELREDAEHYQVVLPLRNKFETVGSLAITMPRSVVNDRVEESFEPLLLVALTLSVAFALFASIGVPALKRRQTPSLRIVYALTFLTMAGFVIGTLIALYSEGAQVKTKALADSLGQRLADIIAFNLNINEIRGLDKTFADYSRLNPDVSAAGLTINGRILIHTDKNQVGQSWVTNSRAYEYVVHLTPEGSVNDIRVAVALPTAVVYRQIARSVKNFTALFVASAFLAGLFLQLAGSVQRPNVHRDDSPASLPEPQGDERALNLLKPVFFVAVFLEHLNYAFLPQFVYRIVENADLPEGYASAPFMAYYLCFALALVPAGHFAQHYSARPLMYVGLVLAGVGLWTLSMTDQFWMVLVARAVSGIGQGMLFIGVQSYILMKAPPDKKTRGAAIIVFGFQGGMISGMAIGSLLVTYMGAHGVFVLSGIIAFALALYALVVVPVVSRNEVMESRVGFTLSQIAGNLGRVLKSLDFLKTMVFIGIPAKAVLTGVIIFALPFLLAKNGYREEDIGQIIMIYAAGVVIASILSSRIVDQTGRTHTMLFAGSVVSGFGLFLIAIMGWQPSDSGTSMSSFVTATLVLGVAIVGIAHGFINAPVVTHVADSELAAKIGASSLTATYRFLERLGHIAGPIIVAQLFMISGQNAVVLVWIGVVVVLLGFLFLLPTPTEHHGSPSQEMAR